MKSTLLADSFGESEKKCAEVGGFTPLIIITHIIKLQNFEN